VTVQMCGRCRVSPRASSRGNTYCKSCTAQASKEYRARHPERVAVSNRSSHLKSRYGMSLEQYSDMLVAQDGKCACCGRTPEQQKKLFSVDHDHSCCPGRDSCGKCVRALLCDDCNLLVGRFELGHMDKVLAYLGVTVR
jgi:hypothetical protein